MTTTWFVDKEKQAGDGRGLWHVRCDSHEVATVRYGKEALLVAAAPRMLQVLRECRDALDSTYNRCGCEGNECGECAAYLAADRAIAAAVGVK